MKLLKLFIALLFILTHKNVQALENELNQLSQRLGELSYALRGVPPPPPPRSAATTAQAPAVESRDPLGQSSGRPLPILPTQQTGQQMPSEKPSPHLAPPLPTGPGSRTPSPVRKPVADGVQVIGEAKPTFVYAQKIFTEKDDAGNEHSVLLGLVESGKKGDETIYKAMMWGPEINGLTANDLKYNTFSKKFEFTGPGKVNIKGKTTLTTSSITIRDPLVEEDEYKKSLLVENFQKTMKYFDDNRGLAVDDSNITKNILDNLISFFKLLPNNVKNINNEFILNALNNKKKVSDWIEVKKKPKAPGITDDLKKIQLNELELILKNLSKTINEQLKKPQAQIYNDLLGKYEEEKRATAGAEGLKKLAEQPSEQLKRAAERAAAKAKEEEKRQAEAGVGVAESEWD